METLEKFREIIQNNAKKRAHAEVSLLQKQIEESGLLKISTGFDYPALEAVLIARSTMSLSLFYQIVGRVMRIYTYPNGEKKKGWVVDMGGNLNFFGKIETMKIIENQNGLSIWNNGRQLTNVPFQK
jgi:DNA repair protein RadD